MYLCSEYIGFFFLCLTGPGFNLFLRELDFKIGPFQVNKFNAPGVGFIFQNYLAF